MLDIGWSEFLVIGVVALVVIGPKELPRVLRTMGQGVRKLRHMAGEFQGQFNEALREAELSDLKDSVSGLRNDLSGLASNARESLAKALPTNPLQDIETELKAPTGSVEAGSSLPPADTAETALPAPGDLEPHPFETVEDEVRSAAAGLEAVAPVAPSAAAVVSAAPATAVATATASSPVAPTAASPAAPAPVATTPTAPRPQTAAEPAKDAEVAPTAVPAALKPKRVRASASKAAVPAVDPAPTDPVPVDAAPQPVTRRPRKPVPAAEVAEPGLFEAVASLDQPPAAPAVKRASKPRVKVKPASGNEGPAT